VLLPKSDDHRVVDDQIDRHQRSDLGRLSPERLHRVTHRAMSTTAAHGEVPDHTRAVGRHLVLEGPLPQHFATAWISSFLTGGVLVAQKVFQQHFIE